MIDSILNRPEIQSAVIPFIVALLMFVVLRKWTENAWLWAVFSAFLVSVSLINGLTITPLTATRKIILLILVSACLTAITDIKIHWVLVLAIALSGVIWVFRAVIPYMEISEIGLFMLGSVILLAGLLWAFAQFGNDVAQFHSAGVNMLFGIGLSAIASASALLGQLALSLSAAGGAVLSVWVLSGGSDGCKPDRGFIMTLPYVLSAALFGLAAVILARLPWYALIPLTSIPLLTRIIPQVSERRFPNTLVTVLPGFLVALAVSFWVWQTGSATSGY